MVVSSGSEPEDPGSSPGPAANKDKIRLKGLRFRIKKRAKSERDYPVSVC